MKEEREELGIVKDIHIGIRDTNSCICWFTVDTLHGTSLQIIPIHRICEEMERLFIYKLEDLNNKPCIVYIEGGFMKFKQFYKEYGN